MTPSPPGTPEARLLRARRRVRADQLRAPSTAANRARNAGAQRGRHRRWTAARDAAWQLIDRWLREGATVALVGAGNGDTLPLRRIAERASAVNLIDVDPRAIGRARRRVAVRMRGKVELIEHDITIGAADAITTAAADARVPGPLPARGTPLPGAPYDLVIGDLFYSQLLYPALRDLAITVGRADALLQDCGPALTLATVTRLQASARHGRVIHLHDPLAWWPGHAQPVALTAILAAAEGSPGDGTPGAPVASAVARRTEAALALAAQGDGPVDSDPRRALRTLGVPVTESALWAWPFSDGVDYLVTATATGDRPARR